MKNTSLKYCEISNSLFQVEVNVCQFYVHSPSWTKFYILVKSQFIFPQSFLNTINCDLPFYKTISLHLQLIISFLCCNFIVLISTYHSLIFFTIASLHFISSIQFKICCQNKSFRCSFLGNTYKTFHTVLCVFNHFTIILLFPLTSSNLCNPMCIFIKVFLHIIRLSLHTSHYTVWFYLLPQSLLSLPHFPCEHPRLSKVFP